MATLGILYQQIFHERYKMLETIFYLVMGIGPSVAVISVVSIQISLPCLENPIQTYRKKSIGSNMFCALGITYSIR